MGPTESAREKHRAVAALARQARIERIVTARIFEHKQNKEVAAEVGLTPGAFRAWCWRHRAELDEAMTEAIDGVKRARAGAALALRAGMSRKVDKALNVFDQVLEGTADPGAKDTARMKAAAKVIDYIDPPARSGNVVNVNMFSDKATMLLKAVASQDLTPRKPLPRPREIDVEAEIVEDEDG
jgi:predicted urease superfamily metal-dependent hydrolase